jgi:hypothetical protein
MKIAEACEKGKVYIRESPFCAVASDGAFERI